MTERSSADATEATEAGVRPRTLAYALDFLTLGGAFLAAARRSDRSPTDRPGRAAAIVLLVATVYHVVLEGRFGRTPGKRLVGIAVRREDGGPCTYRAATVRTLFRFVDWLPAGYLAGLAAILWTNRRRRLGDLAAGTVVVEAGEESER